MAQPDISLADLQQRARQRADMVGSDFVSPSEVDGYCEQAWREFYMRLVSKYEDHFLERAGTPITTANGQAAYQLAVDILKFRGIRHRDDYYLSRIDPREIPDISTRARRAKPSAYWLHGRLTGSIIIELEPLPNASYTLDYYYVPVRSLGDVVAGSLRIVAGWDEYIVLSAAIKMKDKEESDVSTLMSEKMLLWDVIEKSVAPLDASEPYAIVQHAGRPRVSRYDDPFLFEDGYGD